MIPFTNEKWYPPHFCNPPELDASSITHKCNCGYILVESLQGAIADVDNGDVEVHKFPEGEKHWADEYPRGAEAVGNGLLISEAPDMYKMLKKIEEILTDPIHADASLEVRTARIIEQIRNWEKTALITPHSERMKTYELDKRPNG